jgi:aryl-alcohol dehydrogenase-like predicted oxidoreductase
MGNRASKEKSLVMNQRKLGTTDMNISVLGFGSWALGGGDWQFSWGPQDDEKSIAAIHRGIDLGMNWIDTAAGYGMGHSEEVVARALKGRSSRPYVFTKGGLVGDRHNIQRVLKSDSLKKEIDTSLKRLQVDAIDLYQIHWPTEDIEEGWRTLMDARQAGKVRWIGVSNFNVDQLMRIQKIAPVHSLQPPYSLLSRDVEKDILPFCLENNIGVIVYSPMASGLLSGAMTRQRFNRLPADDWRKTKSPWFQEPELTRNLELAEVLKKIGEQYGRTAGEVAIAWTLRNPAVTGAIVGIRAPEQLEGVITAADFRLSDAEITRIEAHFGAHSHAA